MPAIRLAQFEADIARGRDLVGLGQGIGNMTYGRVDASDLFRSALVQSVAALDAYIHGVVLDRAVDMLMGRLPPGTTRPRVGLDFNAVQMILSAGSPVAMEIAARTYVAQRLALETFQRPDDIGTALSMVGVAKIWSTAFPANPNGAKTSVGVIVDRRNRIVHSCDVDPLVPGATTPMSDADAVLALDTIANTIATIDPCC